MRGDGGLSVGVIGCGIVGASVGWHLVQLGARVVFIERGAVGAGVSDTSFAWVNASSVWDDPVYFRLRVSAMEEWQRVVQQLGQPGWWHPVGHLRQLHETGAGDVARAVTTMQAAGYSAEAIGRDDAASLEPDVRFVPTGVFVHFPTEGWIDPRAAASHLVDAALAGGAALRVGTVTSISARAEGARHVHLASGELIKIDAVVNAAGPDAAPVAAMVGRTLPMRHEPGLIARLASSPVPVGRVVHTPGVELRTDGPGSVLVHSRAIDTRIDLADSPGDLVPGLVDAAVAVAPALRGRAVIGFGVGRRPMPIDDRPSVGGVALLDGYYEAVTHSGVTLAAILGRLLAIEIMHREVSPLLRCYRPDRFSAP